MSRSVRLSHAKILERYQSGLALVYIPPDSTGCPLACWGPLPLAHWLQGPREAEGREGRDQLLDVSGNARAGEPI